MGPRPGARRCLQGEAPGARDVGNDPRDGDPRPAPITQVPVYAKFSRQSFAALIDIVVFMIVGMLVGVGITGRAMALLESTLVASLVTFVLSVAYNALGNGRGGTLGKHLPMIFHREAALLFSLLCYIVRFMARELAIGPFLPCRNGWPCLRGTS